MNFPSEILLGLPVLLYAETHYRFRYFFSLLKKSEPELIADVPHRLEPNRQLPVLLLAKDSDRYPCVVKQVTVTIQQENRILSTHSLLREPIHLDMPMWWKVWKVNRPAVEGWVDCDVTISIESGRKLRDYHNDNHVTSSRKPFRIFLSDESLPRFEGLHFGDAHTHSDFTSDQVEFGAPLEASKELSKAMGLSFFCVTDHSYDLDDRIDNYLENDNSLPKWNKFQQSVEDLNKQDGEFAIIPGEEISCRNSKGENVHLLLYGNSRFFHGSGDGAEKWLRTRSEYSLSDVLRQKEAGTSAFGAHVRESVPFLQRLLLRRGNWQEEDLSSKDLDGVQFVNGHMNDGFMEGYRAWKKLLLSGRHSLTIGGNDSHGNFNRFRQIGFPFLKIVERDNQIFGQMRTGLFVGKKASKRQILDAFKKGAFIVTDGPILNLKRKRSSGFTSIGQTHASKRIEFHVMALSTREFGEIEELRILRGNKGMSDEEVLFSISNVGLKFRSSLLTNTEHPGYIRAELFTSALTSCDGKSHFCYSNPIWIR